MTLGRAPRQQGLFGSTVSVCEGRVDANSIWAVLHRECHDLFGDEFFADMYAEVGRASIPPMILAVVMVLARLESLSDRDAVDRFVFDARWKYACGGLAFDYPGFTHMSLVEMRARLARSAWPTRVFDRTRDVAAAAGLVGVKRVLDSTPLYDAVATMDTVTLVRSAIRRVLRLGVDLEVDLRGVLDGGDDYALAGKPACDWDDAEARSAVVDMLARDAYAILAALEGRDLDSDLAEAAALLAAVVGQDIEVGGDGRFRIIRGVAVGRVISTVDPEARHGHKTSARGYDGYKGHVAIDPDSEIITATTVTPANTGDAAAAEDLLAEDLPADSHAEGSGAVSPQDSADSYTAEGGGAVSPQDSADSYTAEGGGAALGMLDVYGDAAYGTGVLLRLMERFGFAIHFKTQQPTAPAGRYAKSAFVIDLDLDTVTCPRGVTVNFRRGSNGGGTAYFAENCSTCPQREYCTEAKTGRSIRIDPHEDALARARRRQADPAWQDAYRSTRPKVERKIGHLIRRDARKARRRGRAKVGFDFSIRAAAVNLGRLATLGLHHTATGWTT